MVEEEYLRCVGRLKEIDEELRVRGADEEYCRQYFLVDGGSCEQVVAGQCRRHRFEQPPLPAGLICNGEFGHQGAFLRSQVAEVKGERNRMNQELERVLKEDPASARAGDGKQERLKMVSDLRNDLKHRFKLLQVLMAQRLALLEKTPVDAAAWHRGVSDLLVEKIELLERLKLGPPVREPASGGSGDGGGGVA